MRYEIVHKLFMKSNTEVNLLSVLMMYELLIRSIIKGNEACGMKQFTSYPLTKNSELDLPPVLIMCELLIP